MEETDFCLIVQFAWTNKNAHAQKPDARVKKFEFRVESTFNSFKAHYLWCEYTNWADNAFWSNSAFRHLFAQSLRAFTHRTWAIFFSSHSLFLAFQMRLQHISYRGACDDVFHISWSNQEESVSLIKLVCRHQHLRKPIKSSFVIGKKLLIALQCLYYGRLVSSLSVHITSHEKCRKEEILN